MYIFQIRENIKAAQEKQKKHYDQRKKKGVKVFEFQSGDLVLKRNMKKLGRIGGKMHTEWTGPYKIVHIENQLALLEDSKGAKLKNRFPHVQLKPYRHRNEETMHDMEDVEVREIGNSENGADKENDGTNAQTHIDQVDADILGETTEHLTERKQIQQVKQMKPAGKK